MSYILTKHAKDVCKRLEISEELVYKIVKIGRKYPSKNHIGQWRYSACRYCVVVDEDGVSIITIYKDKVITPLRDDQVGVKIRRTK